MTATTKRNKNGFRAHGGGMYVVLLIREHAWCTHSDLRFSEKSLGCSPSMLTDRRYVAGSTKGTGE